MKTLLNNFDNSTFNKGANKLELVIQLYFIHF